MTGKITYMIIAVAALISNIIFTYNLIKITKRIEKRKQLPKERAITFNLSKRSELIAEETELLSQAYTTEYIEKP